MVTSSTKDARLVQVSSMAGEEVLASVELKPGVLVPGTGCSVCAATLVKTTSRVCAAAVAGLWVGLSSCDVRKLHPDMKPSARRLHRRFVKYRPFILESAPDVVRLYMSLRKG
jgi:hypothetical protein